MKKKEQHTQERIRLAMEKVKQAESIKDVGLVVSHDALPLLSQMLENSMRRIVQEEIQKATKEFSLGLLEGMIPKYLPAPEEELEEVKPEEPKVTPEKVQKTKKTKKRNRIEWTSEQEQVALRKYQILKQEFPEKSDSWRFKEIQRLSYFSGRSLQSITNKLNRMLKGEKDNGK